MTPNPFDQGARYTAKMDPPRFIAWLLSTSRPLTTFHQWLDTRSIPFPGEPDRVCDTVAGLVDNTNPKTWWALPIEFQSRPVSDLFGRFLEYLGRLWRELRPPDQPTGRFQVVAAVVNLTGSGRTSQDMQYGATGARTCLGVVERNLRDEDARVVLAGIADGTLPECLLTMIPLMKSGSEAVNIEEWIRLAMTDPDARRRGDYAGLALVFAELAGCWPIWKQALEGFNVEVSQQVQEWQAIAEKRGEDRGEARGVALGEARGVALGEARGIAKGIATAVLRVLRARFVSRVPADIKRAIESTTDLAQLDRWLEDASQAQSLADFRHRTGLQARRGGRRQQGARNGSDAS